MSEQDAVKQFSLQEDGASCGVFCLKVCIIGVSVAAIISDLKLTKCLCALRTWANRSVAKKEEKYKVWALIRVSAIL